MKTNVLLFYKLNVTTDEVRKGWYVANTTNKLTTAEYQWRQYTLSAADAMLLARAGVLRGHPSPSDSSHCHYLETLQNLTNKGPLHFVNHPWPHLSEGIPESRVP